MRYEEDNLEANHALNSNIQSRRTHGFGVISGGEITIATGTLGSTEDTLSLEATDVLVGGTEFNLSSQNIAIDAADSNPRQDVVYVDSSGNVQVAKGVAQEAKTSVANPDYVDYTVPAPVDLQHVDATVLYRVWVSANAGSVTASELIDMRMDADISANLVDAQSLSTGTLNNADFYVSTDDDLAQVATDVPAGSTIAILPGEHTAEGVPYRHRFVGYPGVTLSLPSSPANHLFIADSGAELDGQGIQNISLDGGGTTTYDAIHLDDAARYNDGLIQDVVVSAFRRGYSGTQNDRQPILHSSRFRNCEIGVYVNNNHPNLTNVDIRGCTTGLGGDIFDLIVTSSKFVNNEYGVRSLDGGSVNASQFFGCTFFQNGEIAADLGTRCAIVGGQLAPPDTPGTSTGFDIAGGSAINGVLVRDSTGSEFGDVAIRAQLSTVAGNAFYYLDGTVIEASLTTSVIGNNFRSCSGVHIQPTGENCSVVGNTVRIEGDSTAQFVVTENADDAWQPTINDNSITINPGVTLNNPLVEINDDMGFGFVMTGNSFYGYSGTGGSEYIGGDAEAAIIKNNLTRRLTQGTLSTDANTINKDNIELS